MRNFLNFLIRYHAFLLFLALEVFCLSLYFRSSAYPNAVIMYSANQVAGNVYLRYSNLREYTRLGQRNDSLASENARLMALLNMAQLQDSVVERLVSDSAQRPLYRYIPVRIIKNSITSRNNYMTLDRGSLHGLTADMGLITDEGIVGKIIATSEHFSVAMSVLHSKFSSSAALLPAAQYGADPGALPPAASQPALSAQIPDVDFPAPVSQPASPGEGSSGQAPVLSGRLSWDGKNPRMVQLIDIPGHVEPRPGDPVFSSGFGTLFPAGVPIGLVRELRQAPGSYFLELNVELGPDFSRLRHAYAVTYLYKEEQEALENTIDD